MIHDVEEGDAVTAANSEEIIYLRSLDEGTETTDDTPDKIRHQQFLSYLHQNYLKIFKWLIYVILILSFFSFLLIILLIWQHFKIDNIKDITGTDSPTAMQPEYENRHVQKEQSIEDVHEQQFTSGRFVNAMPVKNQPNTAKKIEKFEQPPECEEAIERRTFCQRTKCRDVSCTPQSVEYVELRRYCCCCLPDGLEFKNYEKDGPETSLILAHHKLDPKTLSPLDLEVLPKLPRLEGFWSIVDTGQYVFLRYNNIKAINTRPTTPSPVE